MPTIEVTESERQVLERVMSNAVNAGVPQAPSILSKIKEAKINE